MEKKQTPVEWLVEQVAGIGLDCGSGIRMKIQVPKDIAEQAKAMEKHDEPKLNKILKNLQDSNYLPAMDDDTRDTLISLIKETPKQITMTPKEIATQICDAFYQKLPLERYVTTTDGDLSWEYNSWQRAKECALIAVDEIISSHNKWDDYAQTNSEEYYYWQEIKQEIENL